MSATGNQFKLLAPAIPGAEGPVESSDGKWFAVSSSTGRVIRLLSDGTVLDHAHTGGTPAGLQWDPAGFLWLADMKRGMLHVGVDGSVQPAVTEFEGMPIRGCNDCSLTNDGHLYFTAPAGSGADKPVGEVFHRSPDGHVSRVDQGYAFCNGLAACRKRALLIVAETFTKKLWAFDLAADGRASGKRLFAQVPGDHRGGPDGIDFARTGELLVTNWGGGHIEVFSDQGRLVDRIATPFAKPSNLHFVGGDKKQLLVTEHSTPGVWLAQTGYQG
jgi:gluconolactonase